MRKYAEYIIHEKFDQNLIDELTDKGWNNLSKKEKDYLNNPHNVDFWKPQEQETPVSPKKTDNERTLINKWREDSLQKDIDDKKEFNRNIGENLTKTIDLSEYGAVVSIDWHLLYDFIEENYTDFNEYQIYDIIKNILDAKMIGKGADIDFKFIDKEYTKNKMLWFNVSYDSRIKKVFSHFNEYEIFWIPKLFGAHNFHKIRIEDYKNKYENRRK
jgi:hypothetical protein